MADLSWFQVVVLAVIQGITEFLPISSSAHLVLVPVVAGWPDQGLVLDVAVHVGTLAAVCLYFWRDVGALVVGTYGLARRRDDPASHLAMLVIIGSVPLVVIGFTYHLVLPDGVRSPLVIAATTIGFGILLYVSDQRGEKDKAIKTMGRKEALIIGLAQSLAIIPGTSRSGITMTAALFLGQSRAEAARFSLLLSIPAIAGAGLLKGLDLGAHGGPGVAVILAVAAALSFVTALAAITGLMAWIRRAGMAPFVVYRLVLGAILVIAFW